MQLDSITLEVLRHQAIAAAEEMALTLIRTARTIYVKEVADFGTAIAGRNMKLFAYPEALGVSAFVDMDCRTTIEAVEDLAEGDVILTNDPYLSGGLSTHLPDLQFIRPYFHGGEIVAYGWVFAHTSDIGGGVPSSISPRFSEIFQEGLRIPPLKILKRGEINQDVLDVYLANCRTPEPNLGDIKAMLAALETGARRVADMVAAHGASTFLAGQTDLAEYAAQKARVVLARIPNGTFTFWDYLDHDYASQVPIRLRCTATIEDGRVHLDYAGTDPQVMAAFNVATGGLRHPYLTLRLMHLITSHDKTVPLNHGILDHVTASVPKGTVLNPEFPAAVGVRHATVMRIVDTVTGALLQADSTLVPVAGGGTVLPVVLAEYDPDTGIRHSMVIQSIVCGSGARSGADGTDGRESGLSNVQNSPIERTEDEAGVLVEEYGLRPDSGGPGKWRGGLGLVYTIRFLKENCAVLARGLERFVFRPWGAAGGKPGPLSRLLLNKGRSDERELRRLDLLEVRKGDTLTFMTPGGGGFGNPAERKAATVLRDVERGFVSLQSARQDYGVAIVNGSVDEAATALLRAPMLEAKPAMFDFGSERLLWESVFEDELVTRMNAALLARPAAARSRLRREIFEAVAPALAAGDGFDLHGAITDAAKQRARLADAVARLDTERLP